MKTHRIFAFSLLLATLLAGCSKDIPYFNQEGNGTQEGAVGYLDLSTFTLSVTKDSEVIPTQNTDQTRAVGGPTVAEASGDFLVSITNATTAAVAFSGTYTELKALSVTPMALTPAAYTIRARSANYDAMPAVAWDGAAFQGAKTFNIIKGSTLSLTGDNAFVCTLSNIKTTVSLSASLDGLFKPDDATQQLTTTLTLGSTAQSFGRLEKRAAYFKAVEVNNTIEVRLRGLYNKSADGETPVYTPVDWKQTIPNCKAGQWRNIIISVLNADKGNVQFQLTVETWVYDQPLDVDIQTFYVAMEEVIPDEEVSDQNSPVVILEGADITKLFSLNSSMFDFDVNTCSNMLNAVVTPVTGATITKLSMVIESDNATFLTALATAGYTKNTVVLWPATTEGTQKNYVVMKESASALIAKSTFAGMKGLYDYTGKHTIKFVAVDSQNRTSYTKLHIEVTHNSSSEVGPSIVWAGHSFETTYSPTGLSVIIDITSKTGITGFLVDIDSPNVLTPAELASIDLNAHMDLINPATEAMATRLKGLGFPIRTEIANKTVMKFDISSFMPMINLLGKTGTCNFKLTITDASGTNIKTIKLNVG